MNSLAVKIARALMDLKKQETGPKGLPESQVNTNETTDGVYEQEKLVDPGIKNPVTGTGAGPIIGNRNRAYLKKC